MPRSLSVFGGVGLQLVALHGHRGGASTGGRQDVWYVKEWVLSGGLEGGVFFSRGDQVQNVGKM